MVLRDVSVHGFKSIKPLLQHCDKWPETKPGSVQRTQTRLSGKGKSFLIATYHNPGKQLHRLLELEQLLETM